MNQKGIVGTILIIVFGLILILVLCLVFLAKPYKVFGKEVTPPFKPGQTLLAEKITYMFKKPQIGDRVIFNPQTRGSTYVGLITGINNQEDVTTYTIISISNGRPWVVSTDKISSKIYYPFLDPQETIKIASSFSQSTPFLPSPSPKSIISTPTPEFLTPPAELISNQTRNNTTYKTYTSTQLSDNLLLPYSLQYPETWIPTNLREGEVDTFTLSKEDYQISIWQAPVDGWGCIFEGELPVGPVKDLRKIQYTQINSENGLLRRFIRSTNNDPYIIFDFCHSSNNKTFNKPTPYGRISYKLPINFNQSILKEMDEIIQTLKEIK